MKRTIGLFGGTFNPVHFGHLNVAKHIINETNVSKIDMIPTKAPHYKENVIDIGYRFDMLLKATKNEDNIDVRGYEQVADKNSYALDMVKRFKKFRSLADFEKVKFIVGIDAFSTLFGNWYQPYKLIDEIDFLVVNRPNNRIEPPYTLHPREKFKEIEDSFEIIDIPELLISSTKIRNMIKNEKPIDCFMPDLVQEYIKTNQIYKE